MQSELKLRTSIFQLFRYWLIGVVILFLVAPTDIPYLNRIIGPLLILAFFFVTYRQQVRQHYIKKNILNISTSTLISLVVIQFVAVNVAAVFYTGNNVISAIVDTMGGINIYGNYQAHFRDANIANSSLISRVAYIILLALVKLIFLLVLSDNFTNKNARTYSRQLLLIIASLIYMSFGLARGTFFEFFEILFAYIYFSTVTYERNSIRKRIGLKKIFGYIFVAFTPVLFIENTLRRYSDRSSYFDNWCSSNFCFEPYNVSFTIEYIMYIFATYFANGLYILTVLVEKTATLAEFMYLVPMYSYFDDSLIDRSVRGLMCENYVNCRFVWVPDLTIIISVFGIFSILASNYILLGVWNLEKYLFKKFNLFSLPILYLILLFVLSLPVGSFFTVSSSTIVSTLFCIVLWKYAGNIK